MSRLLAPPKWARRARWGLAAAATLGVKSCSWANVQNQAGIVHFLPRRATVGLALTAYFISRILPTFGTIGKPGKAGTLKPAGQYTKNALPINAYLGTVPS